MRSNSCSLGDYKGKVKEKYLGTQVLVVQCLHHSGMHPFDGLLPFLSFLELQDKDLDLLMEYGLVLFMLNFFSSKLLYLRKVIGTSLLQSAKAYSNVRH